MAHSSMNGEGRLWSSNGPEDPGGGSRLHARPPRGLKGPAAPLTQPLPERGEAALALPITLAPHLRFTKRRVKGTQSLPIPVSQRGQKGLSQLQLALEQCGGWLGTSLRQSRQSTGHYGQPSTRAHNTTCLW